ncbi:MAG TPA: WD40 repeat domain-containing protein [Gemmataceae bacterium]|jgi:WD40 repeat protein
MPPSARKPREIAPLLHKAVLVLLLSSCAARLAVADQPQPAVAKREHVDSFGDPIPADAVRRIGSVRFRPGGPILSLIPCRDGKTLITSGVSTCVWELATGRLLHRFPETSRYIALAPNGAILAAGVGETIHLWDPVSGRKLRQIKRHQGEVTGLAFSPDGKMLASQGSEAIHLWDMAKGEEIASLPQKRAVPIPVQLAFTPDGKTLLATSRADHKLRIWDVAQRRQRREMPRDEADPLSFAVSTDGTSLAIGNGPGGVGCIAIWDVATGKRVRELESERESVHAVAFSPNGKLLASAGVNTGFDGDVRIWDRTTGELLHTIKIFAHSLAFSDGKALFTGDNVVRRWDTATGKEIQPPEGNLFEIDALVLSPDGRRLATLNRDVCLWDTATGKLLHHLAPQGELLTGCAFSPDGKTLATASLQSFLRLWNVSTGEEMRAIRTGPAPHTPLDREEYLLATAFSPDGKKLATTSWGGRLCFWDARTGREIRRIDGISRQHQYLETIAFTADSKRAFAAIRTQEGTDVRAWDIDRGDELPKLTDTINDQMHKNDPQTSDYGNWARLTLSRDGKLLALNRTKTISIWETATGKERLRLKGHREPTLSVAFSPDGRLLASSGRDSTIRFWDLGTGAEIGQCRGQPGNAKLLIFSPDAKLLYSGGADTSVLVWDVLRILRRTKGAKQGPTP